MFQTGDQGNLDRSERAQKLVYTAWHIWKERFCRVYDNKAITQEMVQASIKLDVHSWWIARGLRVGDSVQSPPVV
jgi:hypothetical protein